MVNLIDDKEVRFNFEPIDYDNGCQINTSSSINRTPVRKIMMQINITDLPKLKYCIDKACKKLTK